MKKLIGIILGLGIVLMSVFLLPKQEEESEIKKMVNKYNNHEIEWKSKNEKTKLPIKFDDVGRILLKAKIDDKDIGYLLFDTGYGITNLSNELDDLSKIAANSNQIMDATGKIQKQNVRTINKFSIGELDLKSFKYNSGNSSMYHFSKDSIIGVLGINAIKHFIWDIDMQNKNITISSKQIEYNRYDGDYQELQFLEKPWEYQIPVKVNKSNKYATLDTGCSLILILKDSISITENNLHPINENIKVISSFNIEKLRSLYGSIEIGNYKIKDAFILDKNIKSVRNLLGVPILHSFQRVVLDFKKNKIILINKVETEGVYHPNSISSKNKLPH